MRTSIFIFIFLCTGRLYSQITLPGTIDLYSGPDIKHEEIWTSAIFGSANLFVSAINIKNLKRTERKSNAGFLLFPGLLQLGVGALYKKEGDPTKNIDVCVGAGSLLICIARLVYRPGKKSPATVLLSPYCVPSKKGFLTGIGFKCRI